MPTTVGTIKHRHQSTLPNQGGPDISVNPWNDSEVVSGGTDGQTMVRDSTQTDGWGWGAPAGPTSSLSAITQSARVSTENLSTRGTYDWVLVNSTTIPRQNTSQHGKSINGHLVRTFDWVQSATPGSQSLFTSSSGISHTTNSGDDIGTVLSASVQNFAAINNNSSGTGFGWRLAWPIMGSLRTFQAWCLTFSGTCVFTASFASGAVSPVTSSIVTAASGSADFILTFTFQGTPGDWLFVTFLNTVNLGSSPYAGIGWVAVS